MKFSNKFSLVGLCVILTLTLSAFFCNGSDLHKANRASKQVSDDLSQCVQAADDLYSQKLIDGDDSAAVAQSCSDATPASDKLYDELQQLKTLDASSGPQLLQHFSDLEASIAKIAPTVAHVKSDKGRAKLTLVANSISAAMATLRALAAAWTHTPPVGSQENSLWSQPGEQHILAADMGPIDSPAGIAFALLGLQWFTALVSKFIADGSLTDDQLQAAGLAENQDTRNHAADLIARIRADQAAANAANAGNAASAPVGAQAPADGEQPTK